MQDNDQIQGILLRLKNELSFLEKEDIRVQLVAYINHLLLHDFNRLIQILYRVDVSEQKLKQLLQDNPKTDAAVIISNLLIERQLEKIKTRSMFRKEDDIDEADKW